MPATKTDFADKAQGDAYSHTEWNQFKNTHDANVDVINGKIEQAAVDSAVSTHNSSGTAHSDIRTLASTAQSTADGKPDQADIDSAVSTHNGDGSAHSDIRTLVSNAQSTADGKEDALGDPGTDDYVLSSKADGTRSWVAQTPPGSGVSQSEVDSTVATHNSANDAHSDIRTLANNAQSTADGKVNQAAVDSSISIHNANGTAHSDIRTLVSTAQSTADGKPDQADIDSAISSHESTHNHSQFATAYTHSQSAHAPSTALLASVAPGANISVDNADPANPIIAASVMPATAGYVYADAAARDAATAWTGKIVLLISNDNWYQYNGSTWDSYTGIKPFYLVGEVAAATVDGHLDNGQIYDEQTA